MEFLNRTEILLGKETLKKLATKRILIVGVGGVGGYVAEMLARSGIENIDLVDFDIVDISNINRQVVALTSTVGLFKVDVMNERIKQINPDCNVQVFKEKLAKENIKNIIKKKYDIIVDAIDSVANKVDLIEYAYNKNIKIVSALGAGNRKGIPNYEVCDVYKTCNDGLAKIVRKLLRERQIKSHTVVSTKDKPEKLYGNTVGSIVYHPAMCGCVLSAYVINYLINI